MQKVGNVCVYNQKGAKCETAPPVQAPEKLEVLYQESTVILF